MQHAMIEQVGSAIVLVMIGTREECLTYAMRLANENLTCPSRGELEENGFLSGDPQVNDYKVSVVPCFPL